MYDTVAQYGQVLSGEIDDWHPPAMVRLWQALHPLASGTVPMFALQAALYALGFALIFAALVKSRRWRAAVATGLLALSPLLLGWQMVVLKDAQMLGALVGAVGIIAHYRLSNRRIPIAAAAIVAMLIAYATLVRSNAVFATVPLVSELLRRPRSLPGRAALTIAAIAAILGASPLVSHRVFGASSSGVAKAQAMFDLAAIAVRTPSPAPFTAAERNQIAARHCAKDFFWDPIGDPGTCGPVTARVNAQPEADLYVELARSALAHPIAYTEHRIRHWNSTERWMVPPHLPDAEPPVEAEPNDLGLGTPSSPIAAAWQDVAAAEAASPLGWPIVWTGLALLLLPAILNRRDDPVGRLSVALLVSALTLEFSFLAISIASDLRYHLWSMTASALALILVSDDLKPSRSQWIIGCCCLLLVIASGLFTRAWMPRAPDTYQAMLHAPSG